MTGFAKGDKLATLAGWNLNGTRKKKRRISAEMHDELRPEYGLRQLLKGGVPGKYATRYRAGTNLVLLAPDVAKAFAHDAEAINDALWLVIQLSKLPRSKKRRLTKA